MPHLVARNTTGGVTNGDIEAALRAAQARSALNTVDTLSASVLSRLSPPVALQAAVAATVREIFANEAALLLKVPSAMPSRRVREAVLRGFADEPERLARFSDDLVSLLSSLLAAIDVPPLAPWALLTVDVPAISRLRDADTVLSSMLRTALRYAPDTARDDPVFGVGMALAGDVMKKLLRVSNLDESAARAKPYRIKWPEGSDTPRLMREYVTETAFARLLAAPVTLQVTEQHAYEHTMILAGAGTGKTVAIQEMIARLLDHPAQPSIMVIDSQGDLLRKILPVRAIRDRLIYIDGGDVERPPQLSLFDLGQSRMAGRDARRRDGIENGILELLEFVLGDLLGQDLSAKQSVPFRFLIALMMQVPGATIHDLRAALNDPSPYTEAMTRLSPTAQRWFANDYMSNAFKDTRNQLGWRIDGLLVRKDFERMWAARASKVDIAMALNSGKVVLVNTDKEHLRAEASSLFGKYFIALALAACLDRAHIPEKARRGAHLFIDEAHEYLSTSVEALLRQARKYRLALTLATQSLAGMSPALRDSLSTNTSIKLAGALGERGAETLAASMRTTSAFIQSQSKDTGGVRFACHVRHLTTEAVTLRVPFGGLERLPQLSDGELAALLERNRDRVGGRAEDAPIQDLPRRATPGRDTPRQDAPGRGRPLTSDDPWETY